MRFMETEALAAIRKAQLALAEVRPDVHTCWHALRHGMVVAWRAVTCMRLCWAMTWRNVACNALALACSRPGQGMPCLPMPMQFQSLAWLPDCP